MSTLTETREALPTGTWQIDPTHSLVGFAVEYMVGTFRGSFSPVQVRLEVGEDGEAALTGSAKAESVEARGSSLLAHLLSPEFFDVERTPQISFSSTDIRRSGDGIAVAGELTVKGSTEPVELEGTIGEPITDARGRERVGLTLAGSVDRTKLGLAWNLPLPNGKPALANEVALTAELFLVKE